MRGLSTRRPARSHPLRLFSWVLLGLVGGLQFSSASAGDIAFCPDPAVNRLVNQAAHDGLDDGQLQGLSRRFDPTSAAVPQCDSVVPYCIGLKVALTTVDQAYARLAARTPDLDGAHALLSEGRTHGAPWQLLVALGDVEATEAHKAGDPAGYLDAAGVLQAALNAINEPALCTAFGEIRPEPDDIRRIRKRAQEAVMLSPRFEVARTKAGDCGGIFLTKVRGIDVASVPVPITFDYDKASFTAEGQKAAEALLGCVREKGLPALTLSGHTDAHGSDSYNMDLSARRLNAVGDFLKAGGYAGRMHLIPLGKREPFQPDDVTQHSADEVDQMNRRVELREAAP